MSYVWKTVAMLVVTAVLTFWGRGDAGSTPSAPSAPETSVKGTFTTDAKPAGSGEVRFSSALINRKDADSAFSGQSPGDAT